jgi:signal transduction histidine kinase
MIAAVLVSLVLFGCFITYAIQLNRLDAQVSEALRGYAERTRHEGRIVSRAQVARIVAGTSHPDWVFELAQGTIRYVARWHPDAITVQSRSSLLPREAQAPRLIEAVAVLAAPLPSHLIVNDVEIGIFPRAAVVAITIRDFLLAILLSILVTVFAFYAGDRMAYHALYPLRALKRALKEFADAEARGVSASLPETGRDELRDLIATYNHAIEVRNKACVERDEAEERTHQFIADAGHQLRTPLTVLSGFIGILRKGQLRHPDDGPKILEKMERQIAVMRKLVERLMLLESWRSAEHPALEPTDIGEWVTSIVDPMAASNPDKTLRINTVSGAVAQIDPAEMTYALTNIVANAMKYAPERPISVDVTMDDASIYISVADDGPGISAESLPHIFDRFYRGSRRDVPGSGLGLAIAKTAVERSGGMLAVTSEPGKGARFTITLLRTSTIPAVTGEVAAPEPEVSFTI